MKLTLLGTGNVQACPLYGCDCLACQRAVKDPSKARHLCSAVLEVNGKQILIDANHPQLQSLFPAGSIDAIVLTHYHMDHVQALFELRWGVAEPIAVYQPNDKQGCDDLFKHPGILQFQQPLSENQAFELANINIIPLALHHSKPTLGYLFCSEHGRIAYLTDTLGIPDQSWQQLLRHPPNYVVIDCSHSPLHRSSNHNNLSDVLELAHALPDSQWVLTHISHELDHYLMQHPDCLSANVQVGADGMQLTL
ncbi:MULTISPECIES: phosphonate metabolism protein PhnP [unclassified Agarivorans]|uniref:phosphonate metabolism protein PhnP n=1 Tax=unclassified Agarivorans TaxID=2636026 RepID=UPI0026E331E1|nr:MULTISPECIES: phosphonate metabolism protein PhnP [unclassified Agarivorans]MDO6688067.1 phosphonate metabolism protein PhnP [Agarivorans sp. 3_MG-2023]MDO6717662.1 phosphonate metabolism protein PhnP [Agarivorans sp. 2_MG-2023]